MDFLPNAALCLAIFVGTLSRRADNSEANKQQNPMHRETIHWIFLGDTCESGLSF
jgi:hypothetical protein